MAATMASTRALSRPSEKLGTHSTSVDIRQKHIRQSCSAATRRWFGIPATNGLQCYGFASNRVEIRIPRRSPWHYATCQHSPRLLPRQNVSLNSQTHTSQPRPYELPSNWTFLLPFIRALRLLKTSPAASAGKSAEFASSVISSRPTACSKSATAHTRSPPTPSNFSYAPLPLTLEARCNSSTLHT